MFENNALSAVGRGTFRIGTQIEKNIKKSFEYPIIPSENIKPEDFISSFGKENYISAVEKVQKYINI